MKLHKTTKSQLLPLTLLLSVMGCASAGTSTPEQTDLLLPETGYKGGLIGAQVEQVNKLPEEGTTEIIVLIPGAPISIETVRVIDKDGKPIKTTKPYSLSKDADGESNGVIIYLDTHRQLPFRLQFNSEQ